jgi:hypothetical protein
MTGNKFLRRILEWDSEEKRKKGRPKERWMDGWMELGMTNQGQKEEDSNDSNTYRNLLWMK